MKYPRSTTWGCKNIGIGKPRFVTKTQFLYNLQSWFLIKSNYFLDNDGTLKNKIVFKKILPLNFSLNNLILFCTTIFMCWRPTTEYIWNIDIYMYKCVYMKFVFFTLLFTLICLRLNRFFCANTHGWTGGVKAKKLKICF